MMLYENSKSEKGIGLCVKLTYNKETGESFYSERGVADSDSVRKRFYNSCSSELREYLYC